MDKKKEVELHLMDIWIDINIDKPSNHDSILEYCYNDVCECADPEEWHSGDVAIAFRRWIESKSDEV